MFLDELIQKGWGLGSGISLFIMAGVAQGILWSIFSPLPAQDGPVGIIPFIIDSAAQGDLANTLFRSGQLPSVFGLIVTSLVLLALVYTRVFTGYTYSVYEVSRIYCSIPYKTAIYIKHSGDFSFGTASECCLYGTDVMGKL